METSQPDISLLLPRNIYYQIIHTLRATLPPPVTDTPAGLAHRDKAAMAEVASLSPVNAAEAGLAADYVLARAYMNDCLRQGRAQADFVVKQKCLAMATSLLRQSTAKRSLLMRIQEARLKRRTDYEAVDGAAWAEHSALHLMADALQEAAAEAAAAEAGMSNERDPVIGAGCGTLSDAGERDGDERRPPPENLMPCDKISYRGKRDDDETGLLDSGPLGSYDTMPHQSQGVTLAPSWPGSTRPSPAGEPPAQTAPIGQAMPGLGGDGEVEPGRDDLPASGPITSCAKISSDSRRDGDETAPAGAGPVLPSDLVSYQPSQRLADAPAMTT